MSRRRRRARADRSTELPDGETGSSRARARVSRRRFLSLIAAGSAAAAIAPAQKVLAATSAASKSAALTAPMVATGKVRTEIEKQKKSTAEQLKVIRNYVLPPGSPMAFEFRPLRRGRK